MENNNNKKKLIIGIIIVLLVIAFLGYFLFLNKGLNSNFKSQLGAKSGNIITMNYTGKLADGTVFYSTLDPKFGDMEPTTFPLGVGNVIPGWDEGIVGMKIGEKKTLIVPPEKAYGNKKMGPIPANSTLIYDIEILNIQ